MSRITFKNQPKLLEHDVDRKFNERRMALVPLIRDYLSTHALFKDKDVSVSFLEKGVGSLVSKVEISEKTFVLKVPLSLTFSRGQGLFLRVWESVGVKVPRIYEEGSFGELSYILMEYIDAPVLTDAFQGEDLAKEKLYITLGKTLRLMHTPKSDGYGSVVNGRAEYSRFIDWVSGPDMQKRVDYINEHKLLSIEHGSLPIAFEIMTAHAESQKYSSYCHDDFGTSNIFATDPITVFDPNPRFNNGYMDLGRSIVMLAGNRQTDLQIEQLIEGYFGNESYNKKALQAAVLINATMKLPYSHKKGRTELISNIQKFLSERSGLLDK